jgi:signal transduction histidine kinase
MAVSSPDDILELIHELNIHQTELEIQNEELKRAQQELSDLHRQYERLYEFAPCGYVILNPRGIITRVNLTGVRLLGVPKIRLLRSVLSAYIADRWQGAFLEARRNAARIGEKERLELRLKREAGPPLWVRADITADRDEREAVVQWFVVLVDITREKGAETQLHALNDTLEQRIAERTAELERRVSQLQQLALDLSQAEDCERRRIADILHDDFQQDLAYIKMELAQLGQRPDPHLAQKLARLAQLTGECIEKARHLSHTVNPPALHREGLLAALAVLAEDMGKHHGLTVTLHTQPEAEPASRALASMLYRSVRELLFNVVKHAGVTAAAVEVRSMDKRIRIEVRDGGKGFDYDAARAGQGLGAGYGLYNIEERMAFLGGALQVTTGPGKGSCFVLTVPKEIAVVP